MFMGRKCVAIFVESSCKRRRNAQVLTRPNKQHLPLEITQNFTVQWADFWRLWQIGIHAKKTAKKTLNLTKSKTLDRVDSILRVS